MQKRRLCVSLLLLVTVTLANIPQAQAHLEEDRAMMLRRMGHHRIVLVVGYSHTGWDA